MHERTASCHVLHEYQILLGLQESEFHDIGTGIPFIKFQKDTLDSLVSESIHLLQYEPNVLDLEGSIYIVGDIHGNLRDLIRLLNSAGPPPVNRSSPQAITQARVTTKVECCLSLKT